MKAFTIPSVYTIVDKFTAPIKRMVANSQAFVNSLDTGLAKGERLFRKMTPTIGETTKQMFAFAKAAAIATAIIGTANFSIDKLKEYEDQVASFRTIVGGTDQEFLPYQKAIVQVAKDTRKMAGDTAMAFEKIAGLNAEFAKTPDGISQVAKATIILAKASRDELGASAENLVGIMNQFSLKADQANRVIDVLAAGQAAGASTIKQTAEAFINFGAVAANANITLEESTALVQTLGKFSLFGSEAGNKLKGSLLRLQKAGLGYKSGLFNINDALEEARTKLDKLKTAKEKDRFLSKTFGAENITAGSILLNNIDVYKKFTESVKTSGLAQEQAAINSSTLSNKLEEMKAKWVNILVSSDKATSGLNMAKRVIVFVTDNMELLLSIGTKILLFFAAWKAIMIATRVALIAYNIVLGITGALSGTASVAIGANAVALGAYKVALAAATAAQWLLNVALTANPIGIIIVAIGALIGLLAVVVVKWNEWGAALSMMLGPLGFIVSLVMSFKRNWDMVTKAFNEGGILSGLKAIGKVLLDALLMPMQQMVGLIAKITGADWAKNAVKEIEQFRRNMGVNVETPINPKAKEQEALANRMESVERQNVGITIKDQTGRASVDSDNNLVPIRLTTTWGGV